MTAVVSSLEADPRRQVSAPTISIEVGNYIIECVSRPRILIIGDRVTGIRTYRPLAPTLNTLAVPLLRRCSEADSQNARVFITLEEALSYAYPHETFAQLDVVTRRRIGRLINRLSEVLYPYITLVNIHFDHRCIGYQLALMPENSLTDRVMSRANTPHE